MISQQTSDRITSLRWISMAAIVLTHSVQWPYFNTSAANFCFGPAMNWTYIIILYGIGIGVVPVFFLISGFLQFDKPRQYKETLLKKSTGLLLPLLIWTAIACVEYLALKPLTGPIANFGFMESHSVLDWLKAIFGDYSTLRSGIIGVPLLYQFWFLRDLFILSLLSPLIKWLLQKLPWIYMALCLLALAFLIAPIVEPHSLFFYSLGGLCAIRKWDFFSITDKWIPWPVVIVGCIAAIFYTHSEGIYAGVTTKIIAHLPSFFLLLKLSKTLTSRPKVFDFTKRMAPQSMFLYCAHTFMLIDVIALVSIRLFNVTCSSGMIGSVLFVFAVDLGICTAVGMLLRKFTPNLFSLLSGGR